MHLAAPAEDFFFVLKNRQSLSLRELFSFLREQGIILPTKANSRQMLIDYVQSTLHLEEDTDIFKKVVSNFTSSLSDKWSRSQRNVQKFNKKYEKWLDERVSFSEDKTPIVSNSKKPAVHVRVLK